MISGKKILGIIPARGGSKGLPGKNIKFLLDKPLIAWTIEQAKKSKYLTKTIVSTEDEKISMISKQYGAEVVERPRELAKDDSPVGAAILDVINRFEEEGKYFDIFVLLEPTSPLRKKNDIDNAIEFFIKNIKKADSLVSVGEVHIENPYVMQKIEAGYVRALLKTDENFYRLYRREKVPKAYFPYGVIYLSTIEAFKKYKTFYQKRTMPYIIERWQNYEVDDIYDFVIIERLLKYMEEKK